MTRTVAVREKRSQSEKSHFFALRDDGSSEARNICRAQVFVGAKLYKNRQVCLMSEAERSA